MIAGTASGSGERVLKNALNWSMSSIAETAPCSPKQAAISSVLNRRRIIAANVQHFFPQKKKSSPPISGPPWFSEQVVNGWRCLPA